MAKAQVFLMCVQFWAADGVDLGICLHPAQEARVVEVLVLLQAITLLPLRTKQMDQVREHPVRDSKVARVAVQRLPHRAI
jgi:hypothetical protein